MGRSGAFAGLGGHPGLGALPGNLGQLQSFDEEDGVGTSGDLRTLTMRGGVGVGLGSMPPWPPETSTSCPRTCPRPPASPTSGTGPRTGRLTRAVTCALASASPASCWAGRCLRRRSWRPVSRYMGAGGGGGGLPPPQKPRKFDPPPLTGKMQKNTPPPGREILLNKAAEGGRKIRIYPDFSRFFHPLTPPPPEARKILPPP